MLEADFVQLVKTQLSQHFEGIGFVPLDAAWCNPDTTLLRIRIPRKLYFDQSETIGPLEYAPRCLPLHHLDLRIRYSKDVSTQLPRSAQLTKHLAGVGCWSFQGEELAAPADYWILVLASQQKTGPCCFVVPTHVLLTYLSHSEPRGQLHLCLTQAGIGYLISCLDSANLEQHLFSGGKPTGAEQGWCGRLSDWNQLLAC